MAITRALPRLVGIDVAKELTFTGRVFDGEEAVALGVVTRVADEPLAAARALAAEIAGRSPDAVRAAKRLFDESWTGGAGDTLALEAKLRERAEMAAHWLSHAEWTDGWDPHGRAGDDAKRSDEEERRR